MPVRKPNISDIKNFMKEKQEGKKATTDRTTWKKFERRVASDFGTFRTPLSGMAKSLTQSDTLHPKLYIECKLRGGDSAFPFWDDLKKSRKKGVLNVMQMGEILLIYRDDLFKLKEMELGNIEIHKALEYKVYKSIISLYNDTKRKSIIENKIPLIMIHKKDKSHYFVGVDPADLDGLHKILKHS